MEIPQRKPVKLLGVSPELYERLARLASEHRRSIRGEAAYALTLYVEQAERRRQAAAAPAAGAGGPAA